MPHSHSDPGGLILLSLFPSLSQSFGMPYKTGGMAQSKQKKIYVPPGQKDCNCKQMSWDLWLFHPGQYLSTNTAICSICLPVPREKVIAKERKIVGLWEILIN